MSKLIKCSDAIDGFYEMASNTDCLCTVGDYVHFLEELSSAEPLTDTEQRIFLKAISREEEVCRKVDAEWGSGDEECEINLVHVCHEIIRKVKGALWT